MSYQGVMKAVNELVEKVEENKGQWGFLLGEQVLCLVRGTTKTNDKLHPCFIYSFTDRQIKVEFPTGYRKSVHPQLIVKLNVQP